MRIRTIVIALLCLMYSGSTLAMEATDNKASHPLPVGSVMPDLQLQGELSPEQLASLGLEGAAPHALSRIKAKTIILVAFSMYCPHCQREAPLLNELDGLLKSRGLAKDVKLIGVGIGNSDFEVQVFQKKYAITFPLFSDPEFKTNKELGEVGTPFFYVLNMNSAKKEIRVVDTMLGRMKSAEAFFEQAMKASAEGR